MAILKIYPVFTPAPPSDFGITNFCDITECNSATFMCFLCAFQISKSQTVILNVIFPESYEAKRHFTEYWIYCPRILLFYVLVDERLAKICVISNWVRVCFNMDTMRIRKVRNSRYGRFDVIVVFVPLNGFSRKWCSAKRRFEKKTFG